MAKSFKNLIDKMSKERREKIEERAQEILLGMALQELRKMRKLTQKQLADGLNLNQAALSKWRIKLICRLVHYVVFHQQWGGRLKIVAQFPDGEFIINQFDQLQNS